MKYFKLILPIEIVRIFRNIINIFKNTEDIKSIYKFIFISKNDLDISIRFKLIFKFIYISFRVDCAHTHTEIITFCNNLLSSKAKKGCVVEAGCFKGGSSSKFSLVTNLLGHKLVIFDSFEGIPSNKELHGTLSIDPLAFPEGSYKGKLNEVKSNIYKFGNIKNCYFMKGWFENTMPYFKSDLISAYIDVDLVSSTKTCLKNLYPLLIPGESLYSQDGHLPLVTNLIADESFWISEVNYSRPEIRGLNQRKLIRIIKS